MNVNRIFFAVLLGFLVGLTAQTHAEDPQRPNILLIVADDLGFSELGCYGSEIETQDLAKDRHELVRRLSKAWDAWAQENHVTPLPNDYQVEYVAPLATAAEVSSR